MKFARYFLETMTLFSLLLLQVKGVVSSENHFFVESKIISGHQFNRKATNLQPAVISASSFTQTYKILYI